jgi:hypothetical protein
VTDWEMRGQLVRVAGGRYFVRRPETTNGEITRGGRIAGKGEDHQ